jgi:hypothetical protein
MKYVITLLVSLAASAAFAQTSPTLVQQLSSYLAYEQAEAAEECPSGGCYHYYRAARLTTQLAAAIAACNAGTCLPPILTESGTIAPVYSGNISGTPTGGTTRGTQ